MKKELEIIGKEIEVYKLKLLLLITIAGGSWVYIFKLNDFVLKSILAFVFFIVSYGVFSNILKVTDLHTQLKGLKND